MDVKVQLKYLNIAPRKVRLLANLIKGLDAQEAEAELKFSPRRAAQPLLKLLKSALANARNNLHLETEDFYIKDIRVDQGPMLKRWMSRAMGRATPIQKKRSHVTLVLAESAKPGKGPKKKMVVPPPEVEKERASIQPAAEEPVKERPKYRVPKKTKLPKLGGITKRIFRRKSI